MRAAEPVVREDVRDVGIVDTVDDVVVDVVGDSLDDRVALGEEDATDDWVDDKPDDGKGCEPEAVSVVPDAEPVDVGAEDDPLLDVDAVGDDDPPNVQSLLSGMLGP